MSDLEKTDALLAELQRRYPSAVELQQIHKTLFPDAETHALHHNMRPLLGALYSEELMEYHKQSGYIAATRLGKQVRSYQDHIEKKRIESEAKKSSDELNKEKLTYDVKNAKRVYESYWYTFGFALAGFILSLALFILKIYEMATNK